MVKLGSKSSRKKLNSRGNSNRAFIRKFLRELGIDPKDTKSWIYLAARREEDGTYRLSWYGSCQDAFRDIKGHHVFASEYRDRFFDFISQEQFKVARPAVFTAKKAVLGFPQASLGDQYDQYEDTIEQAGDHHTSP